MKRILLNLNNLKSIFSLALFCVYFTSFATVKNTVADGNWFDATNWSPVGVPLMEDTVIVNHYMYAYGDKVEFGANWFIVAVSGSIVCDSIFALHGNLRLDGTMNVSTYADGDGDSTLVYGTLSGLVAALSNPVTFNYGVISSDTLHLAETFHNYGMIDTDFMTAGGGSAPFTNHSFGSIIVTNSVIFSTNVVNELNAEMVLGDLMTDILITNNGAVYCQSWSHFGGVANGAGTYCIEGCFQNYADIDGSLDICDASPAGFCDWDFGTIAATVTNCVTSACVDNLGMDEAVVATVDIYPNPAVSYIMIKHIEKGSQWTILDYSGKRIVSGTITTDITQIDVSQVAAGVYMLQIQNENTRSVNRFVKN